MAAKKANQTTIAGPKNLPMRLVPECWARNSTATMPTASMMRNVWPWSPMPSSKGVVLRPSTAEVIETAGVRIRVGQETWRRRSSR